MKGSSFTIRKSRERRALFSKGALSFLLFLFACEEGDKSLLRPAGELSLKTPGIQMKGAQKPRKVIERNGQELIHYFDPSSRTLRFIPLWKGGAAPASVPLDSLPQAERLKFLAPVFHYRSPDSLFLILGGSRTLRLLDQEGMVQRKWALKRPDGKAHGLHASIQKPLDSREGGLIVRSSLRIDPFGPTRKSYFSIPPELQVSFSDSSASPSLAGGWPDKYQDRYYYDIDPSRARIRYKGSPTLLYSFKASHSLYLFQGTELLAKKKAKSRYIDRFEAFDEDSIGNIAYIKRFLTTAPTYGAVIWDPFRQLYYRMAFHPCPYKDPESGKVKGPGDQPWSLIVLNEEFERMGEVKMDPERYLPGPLLVSEKGLLVPQKETGAKERISYTIFNPVPDP